ncbi:MAG: hypothetical protein GY799_13665 [Desulfobulbaceae bacterium]|nr:hypothetical protein [Desulfobulbaceae bacterium]
MTGHVFSGGKEERVNERAGGHSEVFKEILTTIDVSMIEAVGHRVVHGGNQFFDSVRIDHNVI